MPEIPETPPDPPVGQYAPPSLIANRLLLPPHQSLPPVDPFELRSLIEQFLAHQYAEIEEQFGELLTREMPRPWPLHLIHKVSDRSGEHLQLHDGRRFRILRWHYATGALRPIGGL
jgi:hypothetical protein